MSTLKTNKQFMIIMGHQYYTPNYLKKGNKLYLLTNLI